MRAVSVEWVGGLRAMGGLCWRKLELLVLKAVAVGVKAEAVGVEAGAGAKGVGQLSPCCWICRLVAFGFDAGL